MLHSCFLYKNYLCQVSNSFSRQVIFNKTPLLATVVPQLRQNGMYYEVNIKGYPRFFMSWSALGRYDIAEGSETVIPYELLLEVSDIIEKQTSRRR